MELPIKPIKPENLEKNCSYYILHRKGGQDRSGFFVRNETLPTFTIGGKNPEFTANPKEYLFFEFSRNSPRKIFTTLGINLSTYKNANNRRSRINKMLGKVPRQKKTRKLRKL
jgi:hypothetical protein